MFHLDPGDDLRLLVETARSFAEEELAPRLRESEVARGVAPRAREAFRAIGLAGLELPEAQGGAGLGALARSLVNEELGAADPGAALALDPLGPALYPLLELGGQPALRELALPLLDREGARAVLVAGGEASLERRGDALCGRIPYVPADVPDLVVALEPDSALVVREGFEVERLPGSGLRAAGAAELHLPGAPIAARFVDAAGAARALARARLYLASLLLGVLRQAAEFSRRYAQERVAFGRPIAHHQALAFLIVDMRAAVDGARLLVHEAAWRFDQGLPCAAEAAAAFVECALASRFVAPNAVQILGGHGFMQDHPAEKYMREARALGLLLGGIDPAREDAGRALCEAGPPVALSHGERA
jgi:alkylation response protein AidB-like acyl-CoA dehydrogenase